MQFGNSCARFKDLLAVVIGGGSGLGKATCLRLAAEGARVVVADLNLRSAAHVSDTIVSGGGSAVATQVDASEQQQVQALFEGPGADVNVLVNSAGTMFTRPFDQITSTEYGADLREAFGASMEGMVWATQQAVKAMQRRDPPGTLSIVNISSTTSSIAMQDLTAYSAAKAAIRQISKSAALELAPLKIRVNTVVPHTTNTEGVQAFAATLSEQYVKDVVAINMPRLIPRLAEPAEIAAGIAFLASSDASFVTGAELVMDGGACIT